MSGVTELGYARFGVSNLEEWREFATQLLGLEVAQDSSNDCLYLRNDMWHHRIILEEDGSDDLLAAGLRVAGPAEFRAMQDTLRDHNIGFEVADAATAHHRRVLELMTLADPSGHMIEIFHGPQVDSSRPFHPGRGMFGRFCTGDGGVGHMLLNHSGLEETYEFYKVLGMRGSIEYRIPTPDGNTLDILFMHCNSRDHTFAFGLPVQKRVDHLMLEVDNLDDVYLTYELVEKSPYPIAITPGKHSNDHMFSFYCVSPSGFQIEVGWGGRPATHQSEYYTGDTYGHHFNRAGQ
jgi:2,3-dihydroxyethylbenzene 1,2-dioxygenase